MRLLVCSAPTRFIAPNEQQLPVVFDISHEVFVRENVRSRCRESGEMLSDDETETDIDRPGAHVEKLRPIALFALGQEEHRK